MLRKTQAIDYENSENLNSPLLEKKKSCKIKYFILPITHSLCIGLGIYFGMKINDYQVDGSL
jgi:hypothetical protein